MQTVLDERGKVELPAEVREALNLVAGTVLEIEIHGERRAGARGIETEPIEPL
jgi:AbrB family looped-hinge helix DNA binding protein